MFIFGRRRDALDEAVPISTIHSNASRLEDFDGIADAVQSSRTQCTAGQKPRGLHQA
jgi:hypothetical protein